MKRKFPILLKVMLLGIGVSILTAGTAVAVSYINQRKRSESTFINSIDNTLDEVDYLFSERQNGIEYCDDLVMVKNYIKDIYDADTDRKKESDFETFEEFENYYKDKYPWIYPNPGGTIGLSKEMAAFKNSYYRITNLLTSSQLSSGARSAFFAYDDGNNNLVMMADSRFERQDINVSYIHVPGSYYTVKEDDYFIDKQYTRHLGLSLAGYRTRFINIMAPEINGDEDPMIATLFIEYDMSSVHDESLNILRIEIWVLVVTSLTLVGLYALFAYLLFVRNINRLSRASSEITQKLIDKDMDEVKPITIKSNDEMRVLADSFVGMEQEIINYVNIIHKETEERERANAELMVASKIQLDSLPSNKFDNEKISLRSYIKTAKEVGGDFYDYFYLDDDHLALIIADVSGKGVPASLFMMKGKELIKSALMSQNSLSEAIVKANDVISKNNKELLFITSFIGVIDFKKNKIRYINAGQEKPYLISSNKVIKLDGESNVVLGVEEGFKFKEESHPFNKGDMIFMFTDGLNESINGNDEEFSYQRIEENLAEIEGLSIDNIIGKINKSLEEFVGDEEQFDDVTMIVARYKDNNLKLHYEKKDYEIITDMTDKFNEEFSYIPEEKRFSVGIIIDEMVNNLVSYEKREDLAIDVEFKLTKGELKMRIISNGEDYNPFENHKEKYLEEYHSEIEEGGFGLSIVKDLSKSHKYEYKNGCSIIEVVIAL